MNLVILLDGSDSIRSHQQAAKDEWGQALVKVGDFIDAFKLGERNAEQPDYLTFVQYSRDVSAHIEGKLDSYLGLEPYKKEPSIFSNFNLKI